MKVQRRGYPPGFEKTLKEMERQQVSIGWFPEAAYLDGTPVAYIAAIHEFGYPQGGIPARSFFRPTVAANAQLWGRNFAGAMAGALAGKIPSFAAALEQIGGLAAGDVGKAISKVTSPPLKPATIKHKKFSKPLVDTGTMLQSVTYRVEAKQAIT